METVTNKTTEKKVFMETFGCQSNVLESDHLATLLLKDHFSLTATPEEADVILFNTCSIREHAEHKVFSRLGQLAEWKRGKDGRVIGVLGCMATSYKDHLLERAPHLDMVVGPDQYLKVPETIRQASGTGISQVLADFDPIYFPENDPNRLSQPHKAFIEIMKGCDKFCTFCVVPFTRGREVSRPAESILEEITRLGQAGVKEVMLLGQNVNSYGLGIKSRGKTITFAQLLKEVGQVPGIERVRFMTSHPLDLSDELVEVMATVPAVCESIHLPVQCGSDSVLKRMGRKYDTAHYLGRVQKLRSSVKDLFMTTDLIVGFPGETDEDFQGTLDLLEKVRYDAVYSFKYSPRLGTPAARMLGQVPEEVKDERLTRLNELAWKHASESCEGRLGKVEEVLVEGPADKTPDAFYGKSRQNRTVVFPGVGYKAGDRVKVKVESHKVANLFGTVISHG
ncbi:MAG TPA: tRNA (N6-isopentenyl adenosine(37)-C2)-methylthiotransferase MiaB, partial [bacterium]|nr:tRNA (N6-isopentenyl adenosine(37)-C2)-methylthiotransferase MiaB [bacterium]